MEQVNPRLHRRKKPLRQEVEGLVCQLSAKFLAITSENIEEVIVAGLQQIGMMVHADHVFLIFFIEDGKTVEKVFEWSASGIFSRKGRISGIRLSVIQDLEASLAPTLSETPVLTSIRDFPPTVHEREYLKTLGIQTIVSLPLLQNGTLIGSFGIDSCQEDRTWFEEELGLLRVTAELFAGALVRFRAERNLQTSDARYRALAQNFPNGMVFLYDRTTRIHMAGGEDLNLCGSSPSEMEGRAVADVFPAPGASPLLARLQEPFLGKTPTIDLQWRNEWYQVRVAPIRDYHGEITLGMVVAQRITEQKRIERELEESRRRIEHTAVEIQQTLLLSKVPQGLEHVGFGFLSLPSMLVDGDFAEFLCLNDGIIDVIFGDVMGKGIPAALIAAATKEAILRNITRLIGRENGSLPSIEQIMTAIARDIGPRLDQLSVFVTMIYLRIDLAKRTVTVVNAGHPPLLHLSDSHTGLSAYGSRAMPLGLMFDLTLPQESHSFTWGDRLLVFSDGITDIRDGNGTVFGEERLRQVFMETRTHPAQEAAEHILATATAFSGSRHFQDDFTCLIVDLHGGLSGKETTIRGSEG